MTSDEYTSKAYSHGNASAGMLPEPPEEIRGNAKTTFISYSTKNPEVAAYVCEWLEWAGIRCWIAPRDLLAGTNFADNIEIALDNVKMLVLILSEKSAISPWVEGEINTIFSAGKPILIFKIDDVELTGAMKIMLQKFPVIRMTDDYEADGEKLIDCATRLLAGENIIVTPIRDPNRKKPMKRPVLEEPPVGNICPILAAPKDLSMAKKLQRELAKIGGNGKIVDVSKFSLREDQIPEEYKQKISEACMVVVVLSPKIENFETAQALIKFAFSVRKRLLPYKIHPWKPSSGLSLMLGMAHWIDVSLLKSEAEGLSEFRGAVKSHIGIPLEPPKPKKWRWFARIFGILAIFFGVSISIFAMWRADFVQKNLEDLAGTEKEKKQEKLEKQENQENRENQENLENSGNSGISGISGNSSNSADSAESVPAEDEPDEDSDENDVPADAETADDSDVPADENSVPADSEDAVPAETDDDSDEEPDAATETKARLVAGFEVISREFDLPNGQKMAFSQASKNGKLLASIGKTEVTQAQWIALMGTNPSRFKNDSLPVEMVSWLDAMKFCQKLTDHLRSQGALASYLKVSLPTSSQWEFFCRAGTKTKFNTGNGEKGLDRAGWIRRNSDHKTHPVAQKQPNAFGLYDMHGNVAEWCAGTLKNNKTWRVARGGSWNCDDEKCTSGERTTFPQTLKNQDLGFRVIIVPEKKKSAGTAAGGNAKVSFDDQKFNERWTKIFPNGLRKIGDPARTNNKNFVNRFSNVELILVFPPNFSDDGEQVAILRQILLGANRKLLAIGDLSGFEEASLRLQKKYKLSILVADEVRAPANLGENYITLMDLNGRILYQQSSFDYSASSTDFTDLKSAVDAALK